MRRASSAPISRRRKQNQDQQDQQQLPLVSSGPIRKQKSRRRKRRTSSKGKIFHTVGFVIFALVSLYGFFIMTVFALHLLSKLSFMSPSSSSMSSACLPVYFWGGGKAGSTTLAALLKHDFNGTVWDPNGAFIDTPKEICWAMEEEQKQRHPVSAVKATDDFVDGLHKWRDLTNGQCNDDKSFVLDACPRYSTSRQARILVDDNPNAKFIMLVRNPIDRMISHVNDKRGSRASTVNVEAIVRQLLKKNTYTNSVNDDDVSGGRGLRPPRSDAKIASDTDEHVNMASTKARRRLKDENNKDAADTRKRERKERKRDILRQSLLGKRDLRGDSLADKKKIISGKVLGQKGDAISIPSEPATRTMVRVTKNHWDLSLYGRSLEALLRVVKPSQVLIVQTEALSQNPQQVVDDIISFIESNKSKKVKTLHANRLQNRDSYKSISADLRRELEMAFKPDVQLLESLVGRSFPWSYSLGHDASTSSGGVGKGAASDWLTTNPNPSLKAKWRLASGTFKY